MTAIKLANESDVLQLAIYIPIVRDMLSFEVEPPSETEFQQRDALASL